MKKSVWIADVAAVMIAGLICMNPISVRAEEVIPAGVSIGNLSLEGLTEAEAKERVSFYVEEKLTQTITLDVNGAKAVTSAKELGMSWENEADVAEAIEGTELKGNLIKRYMKKKDLQENPLKIELKLGADEEKITSFVYEKCGAAVAEAKDAVIERKDGAFVVTPSVVGIAVDMEATKTALNEALNTEETGDVTVTAVVTEEQPKIKTEDLETIGDVLGTYTTSFSSSGWARSTNLEVGAAKINGRVLMPGEVLSGYECMAPFTTANGYKTATAYENGRSVDSIGGGVCQIATTLYNAALYAELDIVQRQNHSMTVGYVEHSRDAAIAGTYKDIKVSNPYDTPIYVEGYTSGKKLTFTFYGKETRPENRTIEFESKTLQVIDAGAPVEQQDASLAPGQRVKVQSGHNGVRSELYKCVYVDGVLQDRTLLNKDSYNSSKAIYRVGPAAAEPVPEETQTPAETIPEEVTPAAPDLSAGPGAVGSDPSAGPGSVTIMENPLGPGENQGP